MGSTMADDANAKPDPQPAPPPMVLRVEPSAPPTLRKPRPGFLGAILWCLLFLAVQMLSAIGVMFLVLLIFALRTDDAGKFFNDQLVGFAQAAARIGPNDPPRPPPPQEIGQALAWGMFGAQVASVGLILLVLPRAVGRDWKRQIGVRTPAGLHIFLVILVVPAFMILADGIQELFLHLTGIRQPAANEALNSTFRSVPGIITFLAVALGPGLVEEIWCRGFLGRGLCARYGLIWGVACTSLLFGMLHVDPSHVFIAGLMGAYLHFVFLASRSIWVPLTLHMLNNGLAVLLMLTPDLAAAGERYKADAKGMRAVIDIAALALLVFTSVALWTSRAEVIPKQPTGTKDEDWRPEEWTPEYPGISAPPPEANAKMSYGELSPAAMFLAMGSFGALAYLLSQL